MIPGPKVYLTEVAWGHPLARSEGRVLTHRKIVYDAVGPGPHPCNWCGKTLEWKPGVVPIPDDAITIDHLNGDTIDNRVENLVISCNACNPARYRPEPKTHCPQGHPYKDGNVAIVSGYQLCKICRASAMKRYRDKNPNVHCQTCGEFRRRATLTTCNRCYKRRKRSQ